MAELSPAAQAVLNAFCASENGVYLEGDPERLAAALRAATDLVIPEQMNRGLPDIRSEFLTIATELKNIND